VDSNPHWNFILLDDPVQSMDDEHSKNLIRILKRISKDRQVIVLSHSRTFYQDFGDLFYGQDYLAYEFSNYTKEGPRITLLKENIDNCLDLAELTAHGTFEERSNAANNIRKAIENFTTEFLMHKCGYTISQATKKFEKLEDKMGELEKSGKIEIGDIAEIKAFLNIGDPGSHARPKRDFTTNDLLDGIKLVNNLKTKYLR
jgi:ATPase subunit of ABC transporter with duplicated ATPase domains